MSVNLATVKRWAKEMDSENEWLHYDVEDESVIKIYCALCLKYKDRLKCLRNYSPSFIKGIVGTSLKKDNAKKHSKSNIHCKACDMERRPLMTLSAIYSSTPLGKAITGATSQEVQRLSKLFDIAYVVAKEEMPFSKYPSLIELEKRHGVNFGNTFMTELCYSLSQS